MHGHPNIEQFAWLFLAIIVFLVALAAYSKNGRWLLLGAGIMLIVALLVGCKPSDTKLIVDTKPAAIVESVRYVTIREELTKPVPIAEGPLVKVIDVARERKAQLQQCNGQLEAIAGVEGTPAPC